MVEFIITPAGGRCSFLKSAEALANGGLSYALEGKCLVERWEIESGGSVLVICIELECSLIVLEICSTVIAP